MRMALGMAYGNTIGAMVGLCISADLRTVSAVVYGNATTTMARYTLRASTKTRKNAVFPIKNNTINKQL